MTHRLFLCLVAAMYLIWGALSLYNGRVPLSTTLAPLHRLFVFPQGVVVLVSAALLALASLRVRRASLAIALAVPLHVLLTMSAFSIVQRIIEGRFADGTVRPWQFIAVDQVAFVVLATGYTIAFIDHYNPGAFRFWREDAWRT